MTKPSTSSTTIPQTAATEQRALSLLRDRYHHGHDLFSPPGAGAPLLYALAP